MNKPLYTFVKVEKSFSWDKENDEPHVYTFASVDGALESCRADAERGELRWYCVQELSAYLCDNDKPGGQIYYGAGYFKLWEKGCE